ncbi:hypothetical protein U1Q18_031554 [Sarracenia purpurea var. burkii]
MVILTIDDDSERRSFWWRFSLKPDPAWLLVKKYRTRQDQSKQKFVRSCLLKSRSIARIDGRIHRQWLCSYRRREVVGWQCCGRRLDDLDRNPEANSWRITQEPYVEMIMCTVRSEKI